MVMILLANLIAARFPRLPLVPVYGLLVSSCVGLYFLDLSRFAFLPYATKALVVGLLTVVHVLLVRRRGVVPPLPDRSAPASTTEAAS